MTYETDVRMALAVMAHEVDVPSDLAGRTIAALRAIEPRQRPTFRRWAYVAVAGAAAILMLVIGTFVAVRRPPPAAGHSPRTNQYSAATGGTTNSFVGANSDAGTSKSGDAVAGQVGAVVSGGRSSAPAAVAGPATLAPLPSIVRTASISVRVKDFEKSWKDATDVGPNDGGYVTNSNTSESGGQVGSGTMTIRVPSDRLERTLRDLRELGTMTALATNGNDVTSQMTDLRARLRDAQAEETQLVNLMNQAGSLGDVIDIRNQLNDTRTEVEKLQSQLNSYQDEVDYSTITATVFEKGTQPGKPILGTGTLGHAVRTSAHVAVALVAGLLILLGGLLPLAALVLLGWFVVRRIRERRP